MKTIIAKHTMLFSAVCVIMLVFSCTGNKTVVEKIPDLSGLSSAYFGADSQWYNKNIPFFECSDSLIQQVYYYRWRLYKAHLRYVGHYGYIVTEFLDNVSWDRDPYSSLNDATGFHIYEGRWLRNNRYMNDYINYMYHGGGNDRHFSEGIAYAAYARYLVNADSSFLMRQLGPMEYIFNRWEDHFDFSKGLYFIEPLLDATEYTISSVDASGGKDGFFGGEAFRPTINSYMYGNALAISRIAAMKGEAAKSKYYWGKAVELRKNVEDSLWNNTFHHFVDRYYVNNKYVHYWDFIRGRELAGYVPWCYDLPDTSRKYVADWKYILDTTEFLGRYGLRTVGPSYQYYMRQYRYDGATGKPECQWNGPSWPFQTTQVLEGMANLLNNYKQNIITTSDYLKILRLYSRQHFIADHKLNLQEDYNPDTGKPIVGLYRSSHYNHSGYNDLIITGLCGIRPSEGNILEINPLIDSTIKYFCLEKVLYHGHNISVVYDRTGKKYHLGKGLTIFIDGKRVAGRAKAGKLRVRVPDPIMPVISNPKNIAVNILERDYPKPSASVNNVPDSLYQAIDGRIWYFPEISNRWSTVGSENSTDWYALNFGTARKIKSVKLFFFADNKTYATPAGYKVECRNGNAWTTIKNQKKFPEDPVGNTVNIIKFPEITTSGIRVVFTRASPEKATALVEIEVF